MEPPDRLADPDFGKIDLVLGVDVFSQVVRQWGSWLTLSVRNRFRKGTW